MKHTLHFSFNLKFRHFTRFLCGDGEGEGGGAGFVDGDRWSSFWTPPIIKTSWIRPCSLTDSEILANSANVPLQLWKTKPQIRTKLIIYLLTQETKLELVVHNTQNEASTIDGVSLHGCTVLTLCCQKYQVLLFDFFRHFRNRLQEKRNCN